MSCVLESEYEKIFNVELKSLKIIVGEVQFEYITKTLRNKRIEEWDSTVRNQIFNWINNNQISSRFVLVFENCFVRLWRVEQDKIHVLINKKLCNSNQYRTNINDVYEQVYNIFIKNDFIKALYLQQDGVF